MLLRSGTSASLIHTEDAYHDDNESPTSKSKHSDTSGERRGSVRERLDRQKEQKENLIKFTEDAEDAAHQDEHADHVCARAAARAPADEAARANAPAADNADGAGADDERELDEDAVAGAIEWDDSGVESGKSYQCVRLCEYVLRHTQLRGWLESIEWYCKRHEREVGRPWRCHVCQRWNYDGDVKGYTDQRRDDARDGDYSEVQYCRQVRWHKKKKEEGAARKTSNKRTKRWMRRALMARVASAA